MDAHKIAISHASDIVAEAILEKLPETGLSPDSLILLDDQSRVGTRLNYRDRHLTLMDQYNYDYSGCSMLLMPRADAEVETLAQSQGCFLVGHNTQSAKTAVLTGSSMPEPSIAYTDSSVRLAGAELSCLIPALVALNAANPIRQVNATFLRSAEFFGKPGVDELATQTINLLNSRDIQPRVYPQQIAFNLLTGAGDPQFSKDLLHFFDGQPMQVMQQSINVPVFHGFAASLQIRCESSLDFERSADLLSALENVMIKPGVISPMIDCNRSFDCVLSEFESVENDPTAGQFWLLADPARYGLANNYVNVVDFLLKSFL